jgi:hypothetical protein
MFIHDETHPHFVLTYSHVHKNRKQYKGVNDIVEKVREVSCNIDRDSRNFAKETTGGGLVIPAE